MFNGGVINEVRAVEAANTQENSAYQSMIKLGGDKAELILGGGLYFVARKKGIDKTAEKLEELGNILDHCRNIIARDRQTLEVEKQQEAQSPEVKIWIVDDINTQTRRVLTNTENNAGSTKGQHPVLTRGHVDDHRRGVDKSETAYRNTREEMVQGPARDHRDAGRGHGGGQSRCRLE